MARLFVAAVPLLAVLCAATGARAGTLGAVQAAGVLRCASNGATDDYTRSDTHGDLSDLADEICKAVAVAVLGPGGKSDNHVWPDEHHMLAALHDGRADVAIGVAPTIETATAFGIAFAPPVFYDGQGLLARNDVAAIGDLAGKQVCYVNDGSLGETLRAAMRARGIAYLPFPFEEVGEMLAAAGGGHCPAISGDVSQLINMSGGFAPIEKRFHLLPVLLSKDPVAPAFRADDQRWGAVVTAVVSALIQAEESGVTAANVEEMQASDDPEIQGLVGPRAAGVARLIGLPAHWAVATIKAVGNYGEIYDRVLGAGSDFKLPRGANQPWSHGGVMYALPLH